MTIWPSRAMVWMILIPMEMSLPGIYWVYAWDIVRHMHLHMPREHFLGIDLRRGCEMEPTRLFSLALGRALGVILTSRIKVTGRQSETL